MKKTSAASTIIVLMTAIACNRSVPIDKNSWLIDELKGDVKCMSRIEYEAIDSMNQTIKGKAVDDKEGFGNIRLTYNNRGYWTEYRSHSADGSPIWTEKPEYDNDGSMRMIGRRDYKYDSILWRKYIYIHEKNSGNVSAAFCRNAADSLLWRLACRYDKDGNIVESCRYNDAGARESKKLYVYDEKGNVIKITSFNGNNESTTSTHQYDENGNRTEIREYDENVDLIKRTVYFYNDSGLRSESHVYNDKNILDKRLSYDYRYDRKGNWIEKIEFLNDKAVKITERQIEYFVDTHPDQRH